MAQSALHAQKQWANSLDSKARYVKKCEEKQLFVRFGEKVMYCGAFSNGWHDGNQETGCLPSVNYGMPLSRYFQESFFSCIVVI